MLFSEKLFFPQLIACCERAISPNGGFAIIDAVPEEPASQYDPKDPLHDILLPVCKLYLLLLSRVTDCPADLTFLSLFPRLKALEARFSPQSRDVGRVMWQAEHIVQRSQRSDVAFAKARHDALIKKDQMMAFEMQTGVKIPLEEEPGPGDVRPEGPRHDNDFADFRKIGILPTDQEIRCQIAPYVPLLRTGSEHVGNPVDRLLDVQFRLLREDMLASVRRGVQSFLGSDCLTKLGADGYRWRSDGVSLMIYRNVSLAGVTAKLFSGTEVIFEFDQLPELKSKSKGAREKYWEGFGSRQLQRGSLTCLVMCTGLGERELLFGTVSSRDAKQFIGDRRVQVGIELLNATEISKVFHTMKNRVDGEAVLLQVHGHFFLGYHPILSALQGHSMASLPFTDILVPSLNANSVRVMHDPPDYLSRRAVALDLSCIAKNEHFASQLTNIPMLDYTQLVRHLHNLENALDLDETQIDAFALAMTRKVALIQGPPGTGKTFVGVRIVRALLANSSGPISSVPNPVMRRLRAQPAESKPALNPILCICYTNHALDQFLEDLVQGGISLDSIVRIGSRSNSVLLQERALNKLISNAKTPQEAFSWKSLQRQAILLEDEIVKQNTFCAMERIQNEDLLRWVSEEDVDLYDLITGPDKDGFARAGGEKGALKVWLGDRPPQEIMDRLAGDPHELLKRHAERAWEWSVADRWSVWELLRKRCKVESMEKLQRAICKMRELTEQRQEFYTTFQLRVLQKAQVVGVTTSGAALNQKLLQSLGARVIVCEEAGEVLESHILASLSPATEHLIMIGDHLQLRPKVSEFGIEIRFESLFI